MDQLYIAIILVVLGLLFGSFAGATVWRLRARQLTEDKAAGDEYDKAEFKKLHLLTKATLMKDRSHCLHCGHTLAWYDLVPLFSWVSTGGKCRYCHKFIGWFEPSIEIATAAIFALSYIYWPESLMGIEIIRFVLWLIAVVLLVILFAYDLRWYLLPNRIVFPLIAVASIMAALSVLGQPDVAAATLNLGAAVLILSGLYFVLWIASKGAWIGFGDVKLGLALALLVGEWQLAFLALFAANLIGSLIVLPGMLSGKMTRQSRVPFGPLLIAGAIIAMFWGRMIIDLYFVTFA